MTDDSVIEQIKQAGHEASETMLYRGSDYPVKAIPYARFLEVLAVFEKTHAPTGEEREALRNALLPASDGSHPPDDITILGDRDADHYAARISALGFHRLEPSAEDEHDIEPWSPTGRIDSPVSCKQCDRFLFIGADGDWEHVPRSEPQGREAKIHGEFVTMRVDEWRRITDELARLRTMEGQMEEPQGEPSDAQVLAALNAYYADYMIGPNNSLSDVRPPRTVHDMRAALRAAGSVR